MAKSKQKYRLQKIGFFHMIRDVLVQSMGKGLFLPACLFILILTALIKMPSEDVSRLVFETFEGIKSFYLFGYFLSFALACGWAFHSKYQRRVLGDEVMRIANERTRLQKLLGKKDVESSEE
jgi:hypothetical protein